jgi:hypothetical protein
LNAGNKGAKPCQLLFYSSFTSIFQKSNKLTV